MYLNVFYTFYVIMLFFYFLVDPKGRENMCSRINIICQLYFYVVVHNLKQWLDDGA